MPPSILETLSLSTKHIQIQRVDLEKGTITDKEDVVTSDKAVCIFINGEYYRTLISTPSMIEELVLGHLLSEGIIESNADMESIEISSLKAYVELTKKIDIAHLNILKSDLITTACGVPTTQTSEDQLTSMSNPSETKVSAEKIWGMIRELNLRSDQYRETGGTHAAMLCTPEGDTRYFAEDVGRHNAVDKVIGAGFINDVDYSDSILLSSGRQSSDIVLKAVKSGIPIIASVAGPLESGIRIAQLTGTTLICFVRGRRMNVYSGHHRIAI